MLFKLNKTKALETLLFVCNRLEVADKHKVSKILYYADKEHLAKYGRMITGDRYVKMDHGPVPTWIYDVIKENTESPQVLQVEGYNLRALRPAKTDELSESDITCLTSAIEKYGDKNFFELKEESHDETWESGKMNRMFTKAQFLKTFPDKKEIEDFLKNKI